CKFGLRPGIVEQEIGIVKTNHVNPRGLYPRSWIYYSILEFNFILCFRQVSPVIPNNYEITLYIYKDLFQDTTVTFTFRMLIVNLKSLNTKWIKFDPCGTVTKVTSCMEYVLVWDMPIVRYTRIFGDQGHALPTMCAYSLTR
ncbi:unnamed protein product, partial [Brugia pahangi]|uniref:Glyco_hydr_116N domain-containing protein n=1 Tax=Brugia pahangi TaxID=6280 RepID=A0A0N4TRP6_BRUPA